MISKIKHTDQSFDMPSERVEIIVDLSEVKGDLIMKNDANTPYPGGDEVTTEAR